MVAKNESTGLRSLGFSKFLGMYQGVIAVAVICSTIIGTFYSLKAGQDELKKQVEITTLKYEKMDEILDIKIKEISIRLDKLEMEVHEIQDKNNLK